MNDGYYDPPDEDIACQICHYGEGSCTCPECEICGEVGNPACINNHTSWEKFPHFHFQLSEDEVKAERERDMMQNIQEQDMWAAIDKSEKEETFCLHENVHQFSGECFDCHQIVPFNPKR